MSIAQPFYTTVPESGMITLPPIYRGIEVIVHGTTSEKPLPVDREEFWRKKTLDEIVAEQGGPKICTNPEEYFGSLSFLWDSEEEMETFLKKRKDEV